MCRRPVTACSANPVFSTPSRLCDYDFRALATIYNIKERKRTKEYLYSAIYTTHSLKGLRHRSHSFTCKLHHACLSFVSDHKIAPPPNWASRHLMAAYYSFIDPEGMKGWIGLLGWPTADDLPHSAGQRKFAGQRPTFYRCATQPASTYK